MWEQSPQKGEHVLDLEVKLTLQQLLESLRQQIKDLCIMRTEIDQAVAEASRSRQIIKGLLHKHDPKENICN